MLTRLELPLVLVAGAALLWLGPAMAEEAMPPPSLSLEECIAIALEHQIDVVVGENAVGSAEAREIKAKSDYYPQVSVQSATQLAESGAGGLGQSNGTSLTVSQSFYDGGLREARIRGARADVAQSASVLERAIQTVIFNVTRDYFALLRARQLANVQDARVKYLEEQQALVQTRVQVGDAAEADVLPVEAQLANARVDQLAARNAVRTSAVQLQNTMGLAPQAGFSIQEVSGPTKTEALFLDDYVTAGLSERPEVQRAEAAVAVAGASVDLAKIVLSPRPVVSGQFNQQFTDGNTNTFGISGSIVFELFNGSRNRAAYDDARLGLSSAELRAKQVGKDIQAEVVEAYLNLTNAKERLEASDLSLEAAQKNFDAQEGRYKQGLAIPLDLLNAELALVTAQSNAVQARYDYHTSMAQLEYAIGKERGFYEK